MAVPLYCHVPLWLLQMKMSNNIFLNFGNSSEHHQKEKADSSAHPVAMKRYKKASR